MITRPQCATKFAALVLFAVATSARAESSAIAADGTNTASKPGEEITTRPIAVEGRGYVATEHCKRCHEEQYSSWHHSYHRATTQVVSPPTVIADIDGSSKKYLNHEARIFRKDNRIWAHVIDPDWEHKEYYGVEEKDENGALTPRPKSPPWVDREIVLSTGSHHMQEYWFATGFGSSLVQFPFAWLIETQQWVHRDSIFMEAPKDHAKPSGIGRWNISCSNCHATAPQPGIDVNSVTYWEDLRHSNTRVAAFGVSCQACHGPGESHARRQEGIERLVKSGGSAPAPGGELLIANPRKLEPRLGAHVCAQCHGIRIEFDFDQVVREYDKGYKYRPGDDIEKFQHFMRYTDKPKGTPMEALEGDQPGYLETFFWTDGSVRVGGAEFNGLLNTPCFTHRDQESQVMTCLSCHALHQAEDDLRSPAQWADDQLQPAALGDRSCLQCHGEFSTESFLTSHTHHSIGSSGSACYNCHMPHTTYGLLKLMRSHTIDSPSTATTLKSGRPTACNLCHLDKTLAWTAAYLEQWYDIPRPDGFDPDQEKIADSVLWILKGDAGLRAIAAWHMGWEPALEISGGEWVLPFLGESLADDYHAVRYIAARSLRKTSALPPTYDFEDSAEDLRKTANQVQATFRNREKNESLAGRAELLLDQDAQILTPAFRRLLGLQDKRKVWLSE